MRVARVLCSTMTICILIMYVEEGSITMTSNYTGNHGGYYCSFCGKSQDEVNKIIAGPDVYICDECGLMRGNHLPGYGR